MSDKGTKSQGLTVWIGTKAADASSDTFTQVKRCGMGGEYGPESAVIDVTSLEDSYKEKLKGIPDNGDVEFGGKRVFTDAGQNAVLAAADDTEDEPYNVRVRIPGAGASGANVQVSFKAIISKFKTKLGDVDGVMEYSWVAAITGAVTVGTYT